MRMKILFVVVISLIATGNAAWAIQHVPLDEAIIRESRRMSLKGIAGVYVRIGPLDRRVRRAGLSAKMLRDEVESRLRSGGVLVLTPQEGKAGDGHPYVNLNVNVVESGYTPRAFGIRLALIQNVYLERKSDRVFRASTWAANLTGYSRGNPAEAIRKEVRALVNRFTDGYHAVNDGKSTTKRTIFQIKYEGPLDACWKWDKDEDYIHKLTWDYTQLLEHFSKSDVLDAAKKACRARVGSQEEFEICVSCTHQIVEAAQSTSGD